MNCEKTYLSVIDEKEEWLNACSDFIWEHPETCFREFQSAAYLKERLKEAGFFVTERLAGIETAFSGSFGSGHPVIGVLAEFDALSGLSQEAFSDVKKAIPGMDAGHGCGHNQFAMGSLAAALAIKKYLEEKKCSGTVIFFGCPAEEGGSGKGFMARDGVFSGLDFACSWHPGTVNRAARGLLLANIQVIFRFTGAASHAGSSPQLGRSALDALELMNIGIQFLREHMEQDSRIHYAITNAGNCPPNVVPAAAEAVYLIRGVDNATVNALLKRVQDCAEGAALMTGTRVECEFMKACSNMVVNGTFCDLVEEVMTEMAPPVPDEEELAFGRKMAAVIPNGDLEHPYHCAPSFMQPGHLIHGSTDVGDVSWNCPVIDVDTGGLVYKTPGHSWQKVAQGKASFAKKAARYAGKVMAEAAVRVIEHPEILEKARKEFAEAVGPNGYEPPIPKGVKPRAISEL